MLFHCKSICSAHSSTGSVGKVGVILDHLIDEQTGDPRDFRELPKVTWQARILTVDHMLFLHSHHLLDSG